MCENQVHYFVGSSSPAAMHRPLRQPQVSLHKMVEACFTLSLGLGGDGDIPRITGSFTVFFFFSLTRDLLLHLLPSGHRVKMGVIFPRFYYT